MFSAKTNKLNVNQTKKQNNEYTFLNKILTKFKRIHHLLNRMERFQKADSKFLVAEQQKFYNDKFCAEKAGLKEDIKYIYYQEYIFQNKLALSNFPYSHSQNITSANSNLSIEQVENMPTASCRSDVIDSKAGDNSFQSSKYLTEDFKIDIEKLTRDMCQILNPKSTNTHPNLQKDHTSTDSSSTPMCHTSKNTPNLSGCQVTTEKDEYIRVERFNPIRNSNVIFIMKGEKLGQVLWDTQGDEIYSMEVYKMNGQLLQSSDYVKVRRDKNGILIPGWHGSIQD